MPHLIAAPNSMQMQPPPQGPPMGPPQGNYSNRPPPPFGQPSPRGMQPFAPGDGAWANPALSPISAYMQQLQSCIGDGGQRPNHMHQQPQMQGQVQASPHMQQVRGHIQGQPQMQQQFQGTIKLNIKLNHKALGKARHTIIFWFATEPQHVTIAFTRNKWPCLFAVTNFPVPVAFT
ncbi:Protein HAIKU1 [Bienertia sinuspersici]